MITNDKLKSIVILFEKFKAYSNVFLTVMSIDCLNIDYDTIFNSIAKIVSMKPTFSAGVSLLGLVVAILFLRFGGSRIMWGFAGMKTSGLWTDSVWSIAWEWSRLLGVFVYVGGTASKGGAVKYWLEDMLFDVIVSSVGKNTVDSGGVLPSR